MKIDSQQELDVSPDKKVDVWLFQIAQYWNFIFSSATILSLSLVGWYFLFEKKQTMLASLLLVSVIIIQMLLFLVIYRFSQVAGAFYENIKHLLPEHPRPLFGLYAHQIARLMPLVGIVALLVLLGVTWRG